MRARTSPKANGATAVDTNSKTAVVVANGRTEKVAVVGVTADPVGGMVFIAEDGPTVVAGEMAVVDL